MTEGEAAFIIAFIPLAIGLGLSALFGLIPCTIAKDKGYRAGLWWLYGFFLFWVALIHALSLKDLTAKPRVTIVRKVPASTVSSAASANDAKVKKLKQYKELLDSGVITQEEFEQKKKELLNF